ncbi:MAG: D-amino acid aminotransferase [Coriobacteriaceae bacterium]|nr:D-amino acid aminotransferase [Coriobacteriaceae bacterium]
MERIGYYNGEIAALEELKVPFLDRVAFYGDGVYDATMSRDGVMLYIDDHLDRFFNSMRIMRFEPNFTRDELQSELQKVVDLADGRDNFVYWQITRGTAMRRHEFPDVDPNLWIMVFPMPYADLTQTVDAVSFEDKRFDYCHVKTLNLLPNVLAAQNAADHGGQEAIFVRDGYVTESAHSNIHILKDGVLVTHPADEHILPGIARKHLIAMCGSLGIPVEERLYTLDELKAADEILISASSTFAIRVAHVDGDAVGGKDPATYSRLRDALQAEFEAYIASHRQE